MNQNFPGMQARTLRILEAASFTPPQALALAEAIDAEIHPREFVTVPVLDARLSVLNANLQSGLAALETKIAQSESRLFQKMASLGLAATGLIITAVFFMVLDLRK